MPFSIPSTVTDQSTGCRISRSLQKEKIPKRLRTSKACDPNSYPLMMSIHALEMVDTDEICELVDMTWPEWSYNTEEIFILCDFGAT